VGEFLNRGLDLCRTEESQESLVLGVECVIDRWDQRELYCIVTCMQLKETWATSTILCKAPRFAGV
jgi:hypothetical protein